jgi:hypothetical protein
MEVGTTRHEALHTEDANESHKHILPCLRSDLFKLIDYMALETARDMQLFEEVQHYVKNPHLVKTTVEIKESEDSTDDSSVFVYSEDEDETHHSVNKNDDKPQSGTNSTPPGEDLEDKEEKPSTKVDKEPFEEPKNDQQKIWHSDEPKNDEKNHQQPNQMMKRNYLVVKSWWTMTKTPKQRMKQMTGRSHHLMNGWRNSRIKKLGNC